MSTYSSNLKIELIATGDQSGVWGTTTNSNFSNVFEQSIVGRVTVSFSNADVTLTATNTVASQDYRNVYLNCTGTNAASRNLIVPTLNKNYIVENNTTGGFSIVVKTSAGTGITIPNGFKCAVYVNGTDVVQNDNYFPVATVGTLTLTSLTAGSITDSGLTSGRVTYAGASGLLSDSATLTYNGTTLTASTGANFATTSGSVGIGTSSPSDLLTVQGTIRTTDGTNYAQFANNFLRTYASGTFYFDEAVVGQSFVWRTSSASSLDTTALTLTSSGNLGLGVTPSAWGGSGQVALQIGTGTSGTANFAGGGTKTLISSNQYYNGSVNKYINNGYAQAMVLETDSSFSWIQAASGTAGNTASFSTKMTLDASGQLGIGTSSPSSYASGARTLVLASSGDNGMTIRSGTASTGALYFANAENSTSNNGVIEVDHNLLAMSFNIYGTGRSFRFKSAGTEVVRIDSSGNVGIGVTPSANQYGKNLQINQTILNDDNIDSNHLAKNAYYNSGWKYYSNGYATKYTQSVGIHSWSTAASGTTGNTITFTQAMTLTASGNLGIGTSSPATTLEVGGVGKFWTGGTGGLGTVALGDNATTSYNVGIFRGAANSISTAGNYLNAGGYEGIVFTTGAAVLGSQTERMRISSGGDVQIGTTLNYGSKLFVSSTNGTTYAFTPQLRISGGVTNNRAGILFTDDNSSDGKISYYPDATAANRFFSFSARGTESDLILTGSGYVGIGTSNPAARLDVSGTLKVYDGSGNGILLYGCAGDSFGGGAAGTVFAADPTSAGNFLFWKCIADYNGTPQTMAYIAANGGFANYSANDANLSDIRLKKDIELAGSYLSKICAIPVKTFRYKHQALGEDQEVSLGVIAQDVEAVAPELVSVTGFGETPEDGIPLKAIYQTDLQYALMKCIQEQQALIESLTTRLTALENK